MITNCGNYMVSQGNTMTLRDMELPRHVERLLLERLSEFSKHDLFCGNVFDVDIAAFTEAEVRAIKGIGPVRFRLIVEGLKRCARNFRHPSVPRQHLAARKPTMVAGPHNNWLRDMR